jgi:LCP family protein required for cell wall assembly
MRRSEHADEPEGRGPAPEDDSAPAGRRRRSWVKLTAGILAGTIALVLVGGSLYAYTRYRQVWESIKRQDVSSDFVHVKQLPPADPHAINVLLIGSDSRSGKNGVIGGHEGISGQRSDTVMVMHISPGAHSAVVLSLPRDSVVPIYSCTPEDGTTGQTAEPGAIEQINATFAYGGPGCLWKTIELTTHIHINDFVELTFVGFEKVIDDLHGVNVCLPAAVDDTQSGLHLAAGRHHIYGAQALAFWRTREDLGEGSDLQRIQRDQFLMASLLQGIENSGLLTSTTKIASVIGDVASHMTTDSGLTQSRLLGIAKNMRGLTSQSVQFIEVPTGTYPGNTAWVQWTPQASTLFAAVAHDTKLPQATPRPASSSGTGDLQVKSADSGVATISHSKVSVEVLNGSTTAELASSGAAQLTGRGFHVLGAGDASTDGYTRSVIEYASAAELPAATTLKDQLSHVTMVKDASILPGTVELILGSEFTTLKPAADTPGTRQPSSQHPGTKGLTKTYGGITGNVNVCHDGSAFAG